MQNNIIGIFTYNPISQAGRKGAKAWRGAGCRQPHKAESYMYIAEHCCIFVVVFSNHADYDVKIPIRFEDYYDL
jgi:hypothetical protein